MSLVSIIIPVYNSEKWLDRCIESLVTQTYKNIELIFVDDESTDKSIEIIKNYQKNFDFIRLASINHAGQSVARNYGVKIANGEYICFVDSDDYVTKDYCELLVTSMKTTNADIVVGGMSMFYNDIYQNTLISKTNYTCNRKEYISKILTLKDGAHIIVNKLFKRELLINNKIEFIAGYQYEDMVYAFETALYSDLICFINKPIYNYMRRDNSSFTSVDSKQVTDYIFAIEKVKNLLIQHNEYNQVKSDFYQYLLLNNSHLVSLFLQDKNATLPFYKKWMQELQNMITEVEKEV